MHNHIVKGKYKAVFSDIDGTLLTSKHKVTNDTKKKIEKINQDGVPFILVSARMPKGMIEIRNEIGEANPMISYSGAYVVDGEGKALYSVSVDPKAAYEIAGIIEKEAPEVAVSIYTEDSWLVKDVKHPHIELEMFITGVQAEEVDFTDEKYFQMVHKILCIGTSEEIDELETNLVARFPEIRIYKSKPTYLEIMSMEASKSGAIRILQDIFDIKQEEIIAFGDAQNDIDMLEYAGVGIAMENAAEEVKEAADCITVTNDEEGVLKALDLAF